MGLAISNLVESSAYDIICERKNRVLRRACTITGSSESRLLADTIRYNTPRGASFEHTYNILNANLPVQLDAYGNVTS